jgi:hypothetical protein
MALPPSWAIVLEVFQGPHYGAIFGTIMFSAMMGAPPGHG